MGGVDRTRLMIGLALTLATAALVVGSLLLARRMTQPMRLSVHLSERMAQGDLSSEIRPSGNEETVRLIQAMVRMQGTLGRASCAMSSPMRTVWRPPAPRLPKAH